MLFVIEDIPSNLPTKENPVESLCVELNLRNNKGFVNCSFNHHKIGIGTHLDTISKSLDLLSSNYLKVIFLGDLHVTDDENYMKSFCENYSLKI